MPLTTTTLSNAGDALCTPDGTKISGARVRFTLVSEYRKPINVWDAATGERIGGQVEATTDANGEFSIDLWPNDRGNVTSYYLCEVLRRNGANFIEFEPFLGQIPESSLNYTWVEFFGWRRHDDTGRVIRAAAAYSR